MNATEAGKLLGMLPLTTVWIVIKIFPKNITKSGGEDLVSYWCVVGLLTQSLAKVFIPLLMFRFLPDLYI